MEKYDEPVPSFMFHVNKGDSAGFGVVERCIAHQLKSENECSFLKSAHFTSMKRQALYELNHNGGVAFTGCGLCVILHPDNRVIVKWN